MRITRASWIQFMLLQEDILPAKDPFCLFHAVDFHRHQQVRKNSWAVTSNLEAGIETAGDFDDLNKTEIRDIQRTVLRRSQRQEHSSVVSRATSRGRMCTRAVRGPVHSSPLRGASPTRTIRFSTSSWCAKLGLAARCASPVRPVCRTASRTFAAFAACKLRDNQRLLPQTPHLRAKEPTRLTRLPWPTAATQAAHMKICTEVARREP